MHIFGEQKVGEWQEVHGYCTAGGDPVYQCPNCRAEHVYGIEHPDKQEQCSVCYLLHNENVESCRPKM